jgi:hypothetical protein
MNKATDPVLETLDAASPVWIPRNVIVSNLKLSLGDAAPGKSTVYRAVEELERYGMVATTDDTTPLYHISPDGRGYLAGAVDARRLDPDGPAAPDAVDEDDATD